MSENGRAGPADSGAKVRLPAEWEPHEATWMVWPHDPAMWPAEHDAVVAEYLDLLEAVARAEPIRLLVEPAHLAPVTLRLQARGLAESVRPLPAPVDDAWARDTLGPVVESEGRSALTDFRFDGYGGRFGPFDNDARLGSRVAELANLRRTVSELVLEGGSIDADGAGGLLVSGPCLLDPRRNPGWAKDRVEAELGRMLGATRLLWVDEGIDADHTGGHVDNVARFLGAGRVAVGSAPAGHPDHETLERCACSLAERAARGNYRLRIDRLPVPEPRWCGDERLAASPLNFVVLNGRVVAPLFDDPSDEPALRLLRERFGDREVVGVRCPALLSGGGGPHCLTFQQPAIGGAGR